MSGEADEQKSEAATPSRLRKLWEEGRVAVAPEVGASLGLLGVALAIQSTTARRLEPLFGAFDRSCRLVAYDAPLRVLGELADATASIASPLLGWTFIAGAAGGLLQTRGLFNPSLALPKAERLDVVERLKKILPSTESATELLRTFLKIAVVGGATGHACAGQYRALRAVPLADPALLSTAIVDAMTQVALDGALAFGLVAGVELLLARRRFDEQAKMSRQEIREEVREEEGDPRVRARRRQRGRELLRTSLAAQLDRATVVVTNPTHVSVALRYVPREDAAPVVVAKGVDDAAMRIRSAARDLGVPIVEDRPLARALHAEAKLGRAIPAAHYEAAARVIAHVLALRRGEPA